MAEALNTTQLWQVIRAMRTIDHTKMQEYTRAADETGKYLVALAPQSNNTISAPRATKVTKGDQEVQNYYLRGVTESITKFQTLLGLTANGEITDKTARAIRALYREVVLNGKEFETSVAAVKIEIAQPLAVVAPPPDAPAPDVQPRPNEDPQAQAPPAQDPPAQEPGETPPQRSEQFKKAEAALKAATGKGFDIISTTDQQYYQNPDHYDKVVQGIAQLPVNDQRAYLHGLQIEKMKPGQLGYTRMGEDKIHLNSEALKQESGRGYIDRLRPEMLHDENRPVFPPEYTVAHEFGHLLTFNKWKQDPKYRAVLEQLWGIYWNGVRQFKADIKSGRIKTNQEAMAAVKKYFPSEYVSTYIFQAMNARSADGMRQMLLTGYMEFVAELYAKNLLFADKFKADAAGTTYEAAIPLISKLIQAGGTPHTPANTDSLYNAYQAATQNTRAAQ